MESVLLDTIAKDLNFIKKQNLYIIEELEELNSYRELRPEFISEVLMRKDDKSKWLTEKESEIQFEKLKKKS